MAARDTLTHEKVGKKFNSSFELVNYAIKLAKNMIQTGRGCRVDTPIQNRAYQVLLEIAENKDQFLEVYSSKDTENE